MKGFLRWYLPLAAVTAALIAGGFIGWNGLGVHDSETARVPSALLGAGLMAGGLLTFLFVFALVTIDHDKRRPSSHQNWSASRSGPSMRRHW